MPSAIEKLTSLGQSLWLDNIQRKLLKNGELKSMIERDELERFVNEKMNKSIIVS